jgi:hypothetical protein
LHGTLASKVSAAIKQELTPAEAPAGGGAARGFWRPWVTALGGLASAAAVAAVAIVWMRTEDPRVLARSNPVPPTPVQVAPAAVMPAPGPQLAALQPAAHLPQSHEPDSYVTPVAAAQVPALVQPTELANYIVAHSAYSGPLMRRNALSALVAGDAAAPQVTAQPIPATVVTGK